MGVSTSKGDSCGGCFEGVFPVLKSLRNEATNDEVPKQQTSSAELFNAIKPDGVCALCEACSTDTTGQLSRCTRCTIIHGQLAQDALSVEELVKPPRFLWRTVVVPDEAGYDGDMSEACTDLAEETRHPDSDTPPVTRDGISDSEDEGDTWGSMGTYVYENDTSDAADEESEAGVDTNDGVTSVKAARTLFEKKIEESILTKTSRTKVKRLESFSSVRHKFEEQMLAAGKDTSSRNDVSASKNVTEYAQRFQTAIDRNSKAGNLPKKWSHRGHEMAH